MSQERLSALSIEQEVRELLNMELLITKSAETKANKVKYSCDRFNCVLHKYGLMTQEERKSGNTKEKRDRKTKEMKRKERAKRYF